MELPNVGGRSANDIAQVLKGLNFPAQKEDLVRQAESNQADSGVLDMLKNIPPGMYDSAADVMERMGVPGGMADKLKGFGSKH